MKTTSDKAARTSITALLLCTVFGAAWAQELPGPIASGTFILVPAVPNADREEQAAARVLAQRRQEMIDDCEQNNGTDCEREVDTELGAEGLWSGARVIHLRSAR